MYVGILRFQVEVDDPVQESWQKAAKSLCEKLRARFKVVAKTCQPGEGDYSIAVVSLAREEAALHQLFEKIVAFCEGSGIGRVNDDLVFIDHLDVFQEQDG